MPWQNRPGGASYSIANRMLVAMCRNIKRLRQSDRLPTDAELHDASLQFVRKISGFRAPSIVNEAAFNAAVRDVAAVGRVLFQSLQVHGHHHGEAPLVGDARL